MPNFAYIHNDDGQQWVRVNEGKVSWDEPMQGWERILDLTNGGCYLRNKSREYLEGDSTWEQA